MKAVIMAGGKGTRLSSITKDVPKPMVRICGKPLLHYQVENLKKFGITDIIMVIGHLGSVIKEYFQNGNRYGVRISYIEEKHPLGTAGALVELGKNIEEDLIIVFGDLFIDVDFGRFIQKHTDNFADITLFAHPNSHPYDSDVIVTNNFFRVIDWMPKNQHKGDYKNIVNAGLYVIKSSVVWGMPRGIKLDLEKDIIIPRLKSHNIYAYISSEYVKDIGTPERYKDVEKDLKKKLPEKRNLCRKQRAIFLDRDGTLNRYVGFLKEKDQMVLDEEVAEAITLINKSDYLAIVITNQPVVARGDVSLPELEDIHNKMHTLLGNKGAYVDDLYYCPHHPDSGYDGEVLALKVKCDCRKPKTGMIMRAVKEHNIDLSKSWFIGDTYVDVMTGKAAGTKTILLEKGDPDKNKNGVTKPTACKDNLLEAIRFIMSRKKEI